MTVVTDFEAHALWMDGCVDLYCVATEETKARLVARGAATPIAVLLGVPPFREALGHFSCRLPVQVNCFKSIP